MNVREFQRLLDSRKGASVITITAFTVPDWKPLKETGENPYRGRVKKLSVVNGMICWQYETAVNRQRIRENKEPDFNALPRKWGTRLHGTPWVIHKDRVYLELKVERVISTRYIEVDTGREVPEASEYVKRSNNPRQELDREIILRDYDVDNIRSFTWGGITEEIAA